MRWKVLCGDAVSAAVLTGGIGCEDGGRRMVGYCLRCDR